MKKRKDGYYSVNRTIEGKRVFFYGRTRAEAIKKAEAEQIKIINGPTFEDVADGY